MGSTMISNQELYLIVCDTRASNLLDTRRSYGLIAFLQVSSLVTPLVSYNQVSK